MERPTEQKMQVAFESACDPQPEPSGWLFYGHSDAPPVMCGAGMGALYWFESSKRMVKFVEDYLAWWHPAPSSMKEEQIAAEVKRIIAEGRKEKIDGETLRTRLNEFMRNMWQIAWWGTFDELCNAKDKFPREVRADFREQESEEESDEAITAGEVRQFLEFLSTYGFGG